jgi:hypothetical protein
VFPARYELNSYTVFRKRLVSKRLMSEAEGQLYCYFCIGSTLRLVRVWLVLFACGLVGIHPPQPILIETKTSNTVA